MIDSQQMQKGGLKIMDMHTILGNVVTQLVGLAIGLARANASSGHPC